MPFRFQLFAQPWWVNLLLFVPLVAVYRWRRKPLDLSASQLLFAGLFAAAFGFVEACVVVYLRAAAGLLPGYHGTLSDVMRHANDIYQQSQAVQDFPQSLMTVEVMREAATIVMLVSVALLSSPKLRERWSIFLWCFAIWDLAYYAGLWATVRWPASLTTPDVLFLIPTPWISQVWFPFIVSGLSILAVLLGRRQATPAKARSMAA
jgi:hypothetical protein